MAHRHRSPLLTLTTGERWRLAGMVATILLFHVVGFAVLVLVIAPLKLRVQGGGVFGLGLGITAYTLGMRHAFDADHIAAIDNTTRKLMHERKRPLSVGFWFSLGHSTVVLVLCFLLAFGLSAVANAVTGADGDSSRLSKVLGLVGTSVSGVFLYVIGILNLVILVRVVQVFRRMRTGEYDEASLEEELDKRGFMNRLLGGMTRSISRPTQMYPIGFLFGVGFDTATEVVLLAMASTAGASGLPWYAVLVLPLLFVAGMSLLDTIDGCFMNFAYGWAFSKPVRKVYYNIMITGLSVAVALVIGTIELVSVIDQQLQVTDGIFGWIGNIDLNSAGYVIVALFVLTWVVALAVWRYAHIEQRWSQAPRG